MLQVSPTRKASAHSNIPIRGVLNVVHIRIIQHDVEMLHSLDRFQRTPILEPNDLLRISGGCLSCKT